MRSRAAQAGVLALAVWQVAAAGLSQGGVLPGEDVGTISDRYDSAIDPAGYAFGIWGFIYAVTLLLAVYQVLPARRGDLVLAGVRAPLMVGFALNGAWIIAFQQEQFLLAQGVIIALTAALAVAYARLARAGRPRSRSERWVAYAPVGLYLGWATIATVAGASTTLLALGVEQLVVPATVWGVLLLVAAAIVVGGVTLAGPPEPGFPLAAAWGLVGITVEQAADRPAVAATAALAAAAAVAALGWREHRINRVAGDALGT